MIYSQPHQEGISYLRRAKVLDIVSENDISPFHWETDPFFTEYYAKNLQNFLNEKISLKEKIEPDLFLAGGSSENPQSNLNEKTSVKDEIETQASSVHYPQETLRKRGFEDLSTSFSENDKEELAFLEKEPQIRRRQPLETSEKINFIESGQNKMKNHPGTIAEKIRKLCQENQKNGQDSRLFLLATINLTAQKKEEFRKWASTFNKNYKTWKLLKAFLDSSEEFGDIFVRMIHLFLSPEFQSEYEEWLEKAQMTQQTKMVLRDESNKEFFIRRFSLILQENNENISIEISKSRKSLKLM